MNRRAMPVGKPNRIMGIWTNSPSSKSTAWICDATLDMEYIQSVLPSVKDQTPEGHVRFLRKVIQFPQDITRRTTQGSFLNILRGLLAIYPKYHRIGLITHSTLTKCADILEPPFKKRIVKKAYFGSGNERASNDWYDACDFIIVAGTPRLGPASIRERLCLLGDFDSAGLADDGDWGEMKWRGQTVSGKTRVVDGKGFKNPAWQKAHQSLVRSSIIQAVGRGRGVLDNGCDVAVISNEACGLPLDDRASIPELTTKHVHAAQIVGELSAMGASKNVVEQPVSTAEVASSVGVLHRQTQNILNDLEEFGIVRRVGERGGWLPGNQ